MTESVTTQKIETTILNNLIFNEEYTRKVIPFIKEDYFQDGVEKVLFRTITSYVEKYKVNPILVDEFWRLMGINSPEDVNILRRYK